MATRTSSKLVKCFQVRYKSLISKTIILHVRQNRLITKTTFCTCVKEVFFSKNNPARAFYVLVRLFKKKKLTSLGIIKVNVIDSPLLRFTCMKLYANNTQNILCITAVITSNCYKGTLHSVKKYSVLWINFHNTEILTCPILTTCCLKF